MGLATRKSSLGHEGYTYESIAGKSYRNPPMAEIAPQARIAEAKPPCRADGGELLHSVRGRPGPAAAARQRRGHNREVPGISDYALEVSYEGN